MLSPSHVVYVHGFQGEGEAGRVPPTTLQQVDQWAGAESHAFSWGSRRRSSPFSALDPTGTLSTPSDFGWAVRQAKSADVSRAFVRALDRLDGSVDVVAHSLGARVAHTALSSHAAEGLAVRNVYVLGGAMPAAVSWWRVLQNISGSIYCLGTRHDSVLSHYESYLAGKFVSPSAWGGSRPGRAMGKPAAGGGMHSRGISTRLARIVNVDCTSSVNGHSGFLERLDALIRQAHQEEESLRAEGQSGWRGEFFWTPPPVAYASRLKVHLIRGALTEIYQRALTEPLDGLAPLLTPSQIDGLPGPATDRAVVEFKKRNGLRLGRAEERAVVGRETWDALIQMPVRWEAW